MRKFAIKYRNILFILCVLPLTAFLGVYTKLTDSTSVLTVSIQAILLLIQIVSGVIYFKYNK